MSTISENEHVILEEGEKWRIISLHQINTWTAASIANVVQPSA